jgi:hypothetical protein
MSNGDWHLGYTAENSHRAVERGMVSGTKETGPYLVEPGETLPGGVPISERWMEPIVTPEAAD